MRPRLLPALRAGALLTAAVLALAQFGVLDGAERATIDLRFDVRGVQDAPEDVVIVAIDDRTFDALELRWPFPRRLHARVVDRLHEDGARVIAYDVQFSEPTTVADDNRLIRAFDRDGGVVLATTETDDEGLPNALGGPEVLDLIGAVAGSAQVRADPDGVVRRLHPEVEGLTAFPLLAARRASGQNIEVPDAGRAPLIDYAGPPRTIPTLSFSDVLEGEFPRGTFRDKVVVVGASAPALQDVHLVATSDGGRMAGPELQANAMLTALRGFPLREAPGWVAIVVALVAGLVPAAAGRRLGAGRTLLLGVVAALGWLAAAQLAFGAGTVLPVAAPLAALLAGLVGVVLDAAVVEAFERRRTRDAFARFVPERVVSQVLEQTDGVRLPGTEARCTALFTDIRGFTTFAEAHPAEVVIAALDVHLTAMSDVVLRCGGTLLSYTGDGLVALFGAPVAQDDHADRALRCAREMVAALAAVDAELARRDLPGGFRIGVGLHTGTVMAGTIGSERQLAYTAVGDTMNTAARIEALTKDAGVPVLLSAEVRRALRGPDGGLADVGVREVRGRREPVWLFAPAELGPPVGQRAGTGGTAPVPH